MKDSLHVSVDTLGREAGMCPGLQTHVHRGEGAFAHCVGKADQLLAPQIPSPHPHPTQAEMVIFEFG